MRAANTTAAVSILAWLGLAYIGMDLVRGVAERVGSADIGQVEFYIAWPLLMAVVVLIGAWGCNAFRRWPRALALLSGISLVALLPYLLVYTGGV